MTSADQPGMLHPDYDALWKEVIEVWPVRKIYSVWLFLLDGMS